MQTIEELNQQKQEITEDEKKLMEISVDNFSICFDPYKTLSKEQLFELIDKEVDIYYYVTLFIMNTIDKLPKDYEITVEMISKIGKYLRNYGGKERKLKLFTELSNEIREMCLNFTPILESAQFLEIWTKLLEFGLKQKEQDIEDGTYEKELEIIPNKEEKEDIQAEDADISQEIDSKVIIETETETSNSETDTSTEIEPETENEKESV